MKEQFDRNLSRKINELVNSHTYDYEDGEWEKFKQHQNKEESRRVFPIFFIGKAASILLAIAFLYYIVDYRTANQEKERIAQPANKHAAEEAVVKTPAFDSLNKGIDLKTGKPKTAIRTATGQAESINKPASIADNSLKKVKVKPQSVAVHSNTLVAPPKAQISFVPERNNVVGSGGITEKDELLPKPGISILTFPTESFAKNSVVSPLAEADSNKIAKATLPYNENALNKPDSVQTNLQHIQPAEDLLLKDEKVNQSKARPILMGVVLTSALSHSDSEYGSGMNIGGGFLSEIPISKRFGIYTGLVVSQQHLATNYETNAPTGKHLAGKAMEYIGVDIPVNIKYTLTGSAKTQLYVSAGLSSLAYLKEQNSVTYQLREQVKVVTIMENGQEIISYKTVASNETQVQARKPFSTFDVGKLINFSTGITFPMKNKKYLILEPYYKYPLGKLTSERMRLGYGGINLRLNFDFDNSNK